MRGITKLATSVAGLLHLLVGCSSHSGTATTPSTVEQPSPRGAGEGDRGSATRGIQAHLLPRASHQDSGLLAEAARGGVTAGTRCYALSLLYCVPRGRE